MRERNATSCLGCTQRRVTEDYNCHSHCAAYEAYKKGLEDKKKDEKHGASFIAGRNKRHKRWHRVEEDNYDV